MLIWFPKEIDLPAYIKKWQDAPISFDADQPTDYSWHVDMHEHSLGNDSDDPSLFERAVEKLFRYEFYPENILIHHSTATSENRRLQQGDRIVQQIRGVPGIVDALTMNLVTNAIYETNRMGFTYRTTFEHLEVGEMTFAILRKRNGDVSVVIQGVSKPGPKMPFYAVPYARYLQKKAHAIGLAQFKSLVTSGGDG
jgi:uncharacterized protein (UPF0548 family)